MGRIRPIPFDGSKGQELNGLTIHCKGSQCFQHVKSIMNALDEGSVTASQVEYELTQLAKVGHVSIEKNMADPFSRTRIVELPLTVPASPTKSNPLSGKGKSYADRVEGPDGWGQYIEPDPGLDPLWNDGKW